MISTRIKQFREYNDFTPENIAKVIGINVEKYLNYEKGTENPTIDIIMKLADCYRVTADEFYGYTPRLELYQSEENPDVVKNSDEDVPEEILKLSKLTWDEQQLILYYRRCNCEKREELMRAVLEGIED